MTHFNYSKIFLAALALAALSLMAHALSTSFAQTNRPNIVIIMTDDQNVDSLPVMRKLLSYPEGSWVKFNNAFANNSICCPARATVLTGQYSHITGVLNNDSGQFLDDTNTLPVWLDNAGYRTGLIGKYLNKYPWDKGFNYIPPGWDEFRVRGVRSDPDGRTAAAVDFIKSSTSPFFLYLAHKEPHEPAEPLERYAGTSVYVPPDPPNFNEKDVSDKPVWVRNLPRLPSWFIQLMRQERRNSQRALLGVDDSIQTIVDTLKGVGKLDNTMIISIGDNGYSWASHRYMQKPCVYEECSRIPLFIRYPGAPANREENRIVSNVDLASTIAEYAGIVPGLPQNGKSLMPLLRNDATGWTEDILLERFSTGSGFNLNLFGIRVPGWKYAELANGERELYDLVADPYELVNQANNPAFAAQRANLAARLQNLLSNASASITAQNPQATEEQVVEPVQTPGHGLYLPHVESP
jgi:N-acetylglucosamine-6-sulfatase